MAERKVILNNLVVSSDELVSTIEDVRNLSDRRYSDNLNPKILVKDISERIDSSNEFEAELNKNLLLSIEIQNL